MAERVRGDETQLDRIERKLDTILSALEIDVVPECKKMGMHIGFVETVYARVKTPLEWISRRLTSEQETEFPAIQIDPVEVGGEQNGKFDD